MVLSPMGAICDSLGRRVSNPIQRNPGATNAGRVDMERIAIVRFAGLYFPVIAAFLVAFLQPRRTRIFPAALLGFVWTLPSLLGVQLLNLYFGWWRFNASGGLLRGMPADLYLGWAVLWGILPILSFDQTRIAWVSAAFFGIDLILMPACSPDCATRRRWRR